MNPHRMAARCPGAMPICPGVLKNYCIAERLYADIDFAEGASVFGFLYLILERNLQKLDSFEGYPKVYRRMWLDVEFDGGIYQAVTYEMTETTKLARNGKPYPEEYRELCSAGARFHHVKNQFSIQD